MTTQDDIVESLHSSVQLELHLTSVFFSKLLVRLHCAHFVDPGSHSIEALVVRGQVWVVLERLLHIS